MTKKIDPFQRMLLIIIVVYSVFVTIKNPGFFQIQTVFDIIKTSSTTMIVAMGLLVVMISGLFLCIYHKIRTHCVCKYDKDEYRYNR